ncbi:MAG: hypothetical protein BAJALOKI2v1_1110006 [Promethearchaeota archaeon]|nr:MAG: hypothetical protein BAJALOKI2v1_1110006 [Candidatus Lokiarchaeota archaeon]
MEKEKENAKKVGIIRKLGISLKLDEEVDLINVISKSQPIEFSHELVESIYDQLSFEEKYYLDNQGELWKLDPEGVVRTFLISSGYVLNSEWYSWGMKSPTKQMQVTLSKRFLRKKKY